uniref:Uncharacterized protein n=1 Tax=Lepeophtheirus salmonis TaxID=72036 RepID=A0A0K2VGU8_LEPSM
MFSDSSTVSGNCMPFVSGNKMVKNPESMLKAPNIIEEYFPRSKTYGAKIQPNLLTK